MSKELGPYVYLVNLHEFRQKYEDDDMPIEKFNALPKEEIFKLIYDSQDEMCGVYTLEQFVNEFNHALDNTEITSNKYLIRIF